MILMDYDKHRKHISPDLIFIAHRKSKTLNSHLDNFLLFSISVWVASFCEFANCDVL